MKKQKIIWSGTLIAALLLTGCSSSMETQQEEAQGNPVAIESPETAESKGDEIEQVESEPILVEEPKEPTIEEIKQTIDLSVKPNEVGKVMVLMYHNIGEEERTWTRTPENFRRDLETLYEKNYRPVSLKDYVRGEMDLPAGMTPFVLTFDDGNENNFRYLETENGWELDPDCAVGILEAFRLEHEDFDPQASFFVYGSRPFRQEELIEKKLQFLLDNGYEVGNHSWDHDDYKEEKYRAPEAVEESLGKNVAFLESIIAPGSVTTLALPYGHRPAKSAETARQALIDGSYKETEYENVAILNVGWDPDKSPYHQDFDPYSIHRVRASETNVDNVGLYDWLANFEKHPSQRYISDGVVEVITVPVDKFDSLGEEYRKGEEWVDCVYTYSFE
jgi:peptidoglycan/xylan/chitin deacetylase (PgdA/CDA1 family)